MKQIHRWKTRLCGSLLAGSMILSLLPASAFSFSQGDDPLSVTWAPQEQKEDGIGRVELSAVLRADQENAPAGAMIEIFLSSSENQALDWSGVTISEQDLMMGASPPAPIPASPGTSPPMMVPRAIPGQVPQAIPPGKRMAVMGPRTPAR